MITQSIKDKIDIVIKYHLNKQEVTLTNDNRLYTDTIRNTAPFMLECDDASDFIQYIVNDLVPTLRKLLNITDQYLSLDNEKNLLIEIKKLLISGLAECVYNDKRIKIRKSLQFDCLDHHLTQYVMKHHPDIENDLSKLDSVELNKLTITLSDNRYALNIPDVALCEYFIMRCLDFSTIGSSRIAMDIFSTYENVDEMIDIVYSAENYSNSTIKYLTEKRVHLAALANPNLSDEKIDFLLKANKINLKSLTSIFPYFILNHTLKRLPMIVKTMINPRTTERKIALMIVGMLYDRTLMVDFCRDMTKNIFTTEDINALLSIPLVKEYLQDMSLYSIASVIYNNTDVDASPTLKQIYLEMDEKMDDNIYTCRSFSYFMNNIKFSNFGFGADVFNGALGSPLLEITNYFYNNDIMNFLNPNNRFMQVYTELFNLRYDNPKNKSFIEKFFYAYLYITFFHKRDKSYFSKFVTDLKHIYNDSTVSLEQKKIYTAIFTGILVNGIKLYLYSTNYKPTIPSNTSCNIFSRGELYIYECDSSIIDSITFPDAMMYAIEFSPDICYLFPEITDIDTRTVILQSFMDTYKFILNNNCDKSIYIISKGFRSDEYNKWYNHYYMESYDSLHHLLQFYYNGYAELFGVKEALRTDISEYLRYVTPVVSASPVNELIHLITGVIYYYGYAKNISTFTFSSNDLNNLTNFCTSHSDLEELLYKFLEEFFLPILACKENIDKLGNSIVETVNHRNVKGYFNTIFNNKQVTDDDIIQFIHYIFNISSIKIAVALLLKRDLVLHNKISTRDKYRYAIEFIEDAKPLDPLFVLAASHIQE